MTQLEQEIRDALSPRRATDAEIDAWTATAMRHEPPRRRIYWLPLAGAAAVLAAVVGWGLARPDAPASPVHAEAETLAFQREQNRRALEKADLERIPAGQVIVIAGGKLFVDKDARKAMAAADAHAPTALHRFVFLNEFRGKPFDKAYNTGGIAVLRPYNPEVDAELARYETPGLAIITARNGLSHVYRRYFRPVGGEMTEIAAGPEAYWYANRAWGATPRPETVRGKPILVLLIPRGVKQVPVRELDGLSKEFLGLFAATCARRVSELRLPNGKKVPMRTENLPVALAVVKDGERVHVQRVVPGENPKALELAIKIGAGFDGRPLAKPRRGPDEIVDGRWLAIDFARLGDYDYGQGPIPPAIAKLDGRDVAIRGYVIPIKLDAQGRCTEFVLVGSQLACCYGQVPGMNEWIHVKMQAGKTLAYKNDAPTTAFGRLSVGEVKEDGIVMSIYRLTAERAIR